MQAATLDERKKKNKNYEVALPLCFYELFDIYIKFLECDGDH